MSSTCFEPKGSSSEIRLYLQLWYGKFYMRGLYYYIITLLYYIAGYKNIKR